MTDDDFRSEIQWLFEPEPDEDGSFPREYPNDRLTAVHGLGFKYMESSIYEGSTVHRYTRLCGKDDGAIHALTRNSDVPTRLFEAGLRLFADSILAYHGSKDRVGGIRFYPPVILTFWAGLEAFIRRASELMLSTVTGVPELVANHLRDVEAFVEKGSMRKRTRNQPVLERYALLLQYGYGYRVDRGSRWWQRLEEAKELRDYYTHLDAKDARDITDKDVAMLMESVLLAIIWPSSDLQRTLHLGVFDLYAKWTRLAEVAELYTEQPFFKDWPFHEGYMFHCNFENVDVARFPGLEEGWAKRTSPAC